MKIVLLTQYYRPEMGAPQNRLYEMMRGLRDCGNEVSIITAMPNYPTGKIFDAYRGKFSMEEEVDGIEVKRYWLYASNAKKVIPRIWNMVSFTVSSMCALPFLRRKKPDFLIVESPPLTLAWSGRWLAKFSGAGYVANISDLWPLSAKELGAITEGKLYKLLEKLESYIYRKSVLAMGQSEEIVNYIKQHGGRNTYLFRNGVDPSRFNVPKVKRSHEGPIRLVYAGLLGFAQGIYEVCRNIDFKNLNAEFHIYGAGGEQQEIEQFIADNPDKGIFYHGVVSRDELPEALLKADMTLIPLVKNIYGAVPSKIYESMAAGLPIMFMGEGEGAKIVKDNNLGLVAHAKDYRTLEENVRIASSNTDLIAEMRKNCLECASSKFNRPKQIKALNDYLLDIKDKK